MDSHLKKILFIFISAVLSTHSIADYSADDLDDRGSCGKFRVLIDSSIINPSPFIKAKPKPVDWSYCDLSGQSFSRLNLTNANLKGANLAGADFSGSILKGADISDTLLTGTILTDAQVSTVESFENATIDGNFANFPGIAASGITEKLIPVFAEQSTTVENNSPHFAIHDENALGQPARYSQTGVDPKPYYRAWLKIDLGDVYPVDSITLDINGDATSQTDGSSEIEIHTSAENYTAYINRLSYEYRFIEPPIELVTTHTDLNSVDVIAVKKYARYIWLASKKNNIAINHIDVQGYKQAGYKLTNQVVSYAEKNLKNSNNNFDAQYILKNNKYQESLKFINDTRDARNKYQSLHDWGTVKSVQDRVARSSNILKGIIEVLDKTENAGKHLDNADKASNGIPNVGFLKRLKSSIKSVISPASRKLKELEKKEYIKKLEQVDSSLSTISKSLKLDIINSHQIANIQQRFVDRIRAEILQNNFNRSPDILPLEQVSLDELLNVLTLHETGQITIEDRYEDVSYLDLVKYRVVKNNNDSLRQYVGGIYALSKAIYSIENGLITTYNQAKYLEEKLSFIQSSLSWASSSTIRRINSIINDEVCIEFFFFDVCISVKKLLNAGSHIPYYDDLMDLVLSPLNRVTSPITSSLNISIPYSNFNYLDLIDTPTFPSFSFNSDPGKLEYGGIDLPPYILTDNDQNDNDNDQLKDISEYKQNASVLAYTSIYHQDTDLDKIPDWYEVKYNLNPINASTDNDEDSDGVTDYQEFLMLSNPTSSDTDNDGLDDKFEYINRFTNSHFRNNNSFVTDMNNPADGELDFDNDGLTNSFEFELGSNVFNADSDFDGLNDKQEVDAGSKFWLSDSDLDGIGDLDEVNNGLNPNLADSTLDPDNDGINSGLEIGKNLNPNNPDIDSDGDGLPDDWEMYYFSTLNNDESADSDSDHLTNSEEFTLRTSPTVNNHILANSGDYVVRSSSIKFEHYSNFSTVPEGSPGEGNSTFAEPIDLQVFDDTNDLIDINFNQQESHQVLLNQPFFFLGNTYNELYINKYGAAYFGNFNNAKSGKLRFISPWRDVQGVYQASMDQEKSKISYKIVTTTDETTNEEIIKGVLIDVAINYPIKISLDQRYLEKDKYHNQYSVISSVKKEKLIASHQQLSKLVDNRDSLIFKDIELPTSYMSEIKYQIYIERQGSVIFNYLNTQQPNLVASSENNSEVALSNFSLRGLTGNSSIGYVADNYAIEYKFNKGLATAVDLNEFSDCRDESISEERKQECQERQGIDTYLIKNNASIEGVYSLANNSKRNFDLTLEVLPGHRWPITIANNEFSLTPKNTSGDNGQTSFIIDAPSETLAPVDIVSFKAYNSELGINQYHNIALSTCNTNINSDSPNADEKHPLCNGHSNGAEKYQTETSRRSELGVFIFAGQIAQSLDSNNPHNPYYFNTTPSSYHQPIHLAHTMPLDAEKLEPGVNRLKDYAYRIEFKQAEMDDIQYFSKGEIAKQHFDPYFKPGQDARIYLCIKIPSDIDKNRLVVFSEKSIRNEADTGWQTHYSPLKADSWYHLINEDGNFLPCYNDVTPAFTIGDTGKSVLISVAAPFDGNEFDFDGHENGRTIASYFFGYSQHVLSEDNYQLNTGELLSVSVEQGVKANDNAVTEDLVELISSPKHGELTFNDDGSFNYKHDNSRTFTDSFEYRLIGAQQGFNSYMPEHPNRADDSAVKVNLDIEQPPLLASDNESLRFYEDAATQVIRIKIHDEELAQLQLSLINQPQSGAIEYKIVEIAGVHYLEISYTASANDNGVRTAIIRATDINGFSDDIEVQFNVIAVNDAPDSITDSYNLSVGEELVVTPELGLLANDIDIDSPLTAIIVTKPQDGVVKLAEDGSFSYQHDYNYQTSVDGFEYQVTDGEFFTTSTYVSLAVALTAEVAQANDDQYQVAENSLLAIAKEKGLLANDNFQRGAITEADFAKVNIEITVQPEHGQLTANTDGSFSYQHDGSEAVSDSFHYRIKESQAQNNEGQVIINISADNDQPNIQKSHIFQALTVGLDQQLNFSLFAQDAEISAIASALNASEDAINGEDLSDQFETFKWHIVQAPEVGVLESVIVGETKDQADFTYTPLDGYKGTLTLIVQAEDNEGKKSEPLSIEILVDTSNTAPAATDFNFKLKQGKSISFDIKDVIAQATDAEADQLKFRQADIPTFGQITINDQGIATYQHDASRNGSDTVAYQVFDGLMASPIANISFDIELEALPDPTDNAGGTPEPKKKSKKKSGGDMSQLFLFLSFISLCLIQRRRKSA